MAKKRFYRDFTNTTRWTTFRIKEETSDLYIKAQHDLTGLSQQFLSKLRLDVRNHCEKQKNFLTALGPVTKAEAVPPLIQSMYYASERTGTGPMAAVAGAIAQQLGYSLVQYSDEIIIENGGDIWLKLVRPVSVKIYSGEHYFKDTISIMIQPEQTPCAVCTSSATIGDSISFGRADAVTVIAHDGAHADALATATCNMVVNDESIEPALNFAIDNGATGVIIILRDKIAFLGTVELTTQ